jgi:RTX calcium-binding nonapeptide repeat (4 copies)
MTHVLPVAAAIAVLALPGSAAAKTVHGTPANDTLVGTPQRDSIYGLAGDDELFGGSGADHLDGGVGQDRIIGGLGDDTIFGGRGTPVSESDPHGRHEHIRGGPGDDVIVVRGGAVLVWGGPGDDRIDLRDPQDSCRLSVRKFDAVHPTRAFDPPHCIDLVNTGTGRNVVRADDGNYDNIDCFGRHDRVIVDQYDGVSGCEVVTRRRR